MSYKAYENTGNYEEIIIYNKYQEIAEKVTKGKAPEEYLDIFDRTVRVETRNKNSKLNADIAKKKVESKELGVYYTIKGTSELYNTLINKIFSTEDFYRIDVAIKIIKDDTKMRRSTKAKLIKLLRLINRRGYSKAKEIWTENNDRTTFYNNIKAIKNLGINPLTFDRVINGEPVNKERVSNFASLANGADDPFEKFKAKFVGFSNSIPESELEEQDQLYDDIKSTRDPLFLLPKHIKNGRRTTICF